MYITGGCKCQSPGFVLQYRISGLSHAEFIVHTSGRARRIHISRQNRTYTQAESTIRLRSAQILEASRIYPIQIFFLPPRTPARNNIPTGWPGPSHLLNPRGTDIRSLAHFHPQNKQTAPPSTHPYTYNPPSRTEDPQKPRHNTYHVHNPSPPSSPSPYLLDPPPPIPPLPSYRSP